MSDTKDLIAAIITGKDYNEIFAQVMANKTSELLAQKKEQIAQSMFEASLNPMSGVGSPKIVDRQEDDEKWVPAINVRSAYTQAYAKHSKKGNKPTQAKELAYADVEKKHGAKAVSGLKSYHEKNMNESSEDDSILEAEMTKAQMDKREEIVLAIKGKNDENVPTLKKRYGARWKDVVYATATKQAMQ